MSQSQKVLPITHELESLRASTGRLLDALEKKDKLIEALSGRDRPIAELKGQIDAQNAVIKEARK